MALFGSHNHVCGLYYLDKITDNSGGQFRTSPTRRYLPRVSLSAHTRIIAATSRTVLTQKFVNPNKDKPIPELRYTFPLYDGVSVVGFVCTINNNRVIQGLVKERDQARQTFKEAVARGETAGLLEQLPEASDVFTTTIGNVPAGAEIRVDMTYLGELKHDAETDGIRFTIPTSIAPRYGTLPGQLLEAPQSVSARPQSGIEIVVDAEMPAGCNIKSIQSPSHPIAVTVGNTSTSAKDADISLQKASATLSLGFAELDKDFVLHVVATNMGSPVVVLETHPTIFGQRALMATLVPKFSLPPSRPEIVFVCDRSGSMRDKISNLKTALGIFLKSLPVGVKFNICSFGSRHEFLFADGSRSYDATSLERAMGYVDRFGADFGGTEMYRPMEETFKKRYKDMDLEVFLLTDGEIWDQEALVGLVNKEVGESEDSVRVFTLGIGRDVSHALIEGVAEAGNGFAQTVGENEKMNSKVVRMLKAALSPHVRDYTMELKYGTEQPSASASPAEDDDDFEIIEKVMDSLVIDIPDEKPEWVSSTTPESKTPISLFDPSADPDTTMADANLDQSAGGKYSHVPTVPVPKILQAPFKIPSLYAFNRTSVYLLLSPGSVQNKTPKSVILRGRSSRRPLELEIPVTVLADKGETIHQLAARKAVKELEQGRGWLYHAMDTHHGPGGKKLLLRDKFEGRFPDMVEREAVRLGITFQVGGKWCSFVAVEKNNIGGEKVQLRQEEEEKEEKVDNVEFELCSAPANPPPLAAPRSFARGGSFNSFSGRGGGGGGGSFVSRLGGGARVSRKSAGLFAFGGGLQQSKGAMPAMAAAVPPPPPPQPQSAPAPAGVPEAVWGTLDDFSMHLAAPLPDEDVDLIDYSSDDEGRYSPASPGVEYSPTSPIASYSPVSAHGGNDGDLGTHGGGGGGDVLEALVVAQTFTGSWAWTKSLLKVLGVDGDDDDGEAALEAKLAGIGAKEGAFRTGTDLLATGLAVAYLEKKMVSRRDEWEMLADKARNWMAAELEGAGSGLSVGEFVDKVGRCL